MVYKELNRMMELMKDESKWDNSEEEIQAHKTIKN